MAFCLITNHHGAVKPSLARSLAAWLGLMRASKQCLFMGNLDALRDWGHASDYVEMQWRMLQQETPEDFVIATGRQESVRRFIELSANALGWGNLQWEGEGAQEIGRRSRHRCSCGKDRPALFPTGRS